MDDSFFDLSGSNARALGLCFLIETNGIAMPDTTPTLTIVYDADCGFCTHMAESWANKTPSQTVHLIPGQSRPDYKAQMEAMNSWLVINETGEPQFRFDGILEIMRHIPSMQWLVPILCFYPCRLAGNIGYRFVSINRRLISRLFFRNAVCKWG